VQGYVDSARRADMSDIADTALRRLGRDIRTAVPNSIRMPVPVGSTYIEFLPTSDAGRYRVNATSGGVGCKVPAVAGDVDGAAFAFGTTDSCFGIIGTGMNLTAGDSIVIGSTQSTGVLPYLAPGTAGSVRRLVAVGGVGLTTVQITPAAVFPFTAEKEGHRFSVVPVAEQAVTYACVGPAGTDPNGDGTMTLTRYWGYGFIADPTKAVPPAFAGQATVPSAAVLATNVSACNFVYDPASYTDSLVAVRLTISRGGESVNLYHEIHVNNIP
jgi:MSHA biogenesis protein MshO